MYTQIEADKLSNKEGLKAYLDLIKAKKLIRLMQHEYYNSHHEVFYIDPMEIPVVSSRTDH